MTAIISTFTKILISLRGSTQFVPHREQHGKVCCEDVTVFHKCTDVKRACGRFG
jgi:hypothetical protein